MTFDVCAQYSKRVADIRVLYTVTSIMCGTAKNVLHSAVPINRRAENYFSIINRRYCVNVFRFGKRTDYSIMVTRNEGAAAADKIVGDKTETKRVRKVEIPLIHRRRL